MRLTDRFRAQLAKDPDAVAIVDGDHELTYQQLADRADRVRQQLAGAGVPAGALVGLLLPRGADVAVAILGILDHDCAYVPVDPAYPQARRDYLLTDAGVAATVDHDPGTGAMRVQRRPLAVDRAHPLPPDAAYVIYTSGSTGAPKGVVVGHRHVLALMDACQSRFSFSAADVWPLFHSHSFDFSVWELWGALLYGGVALVVPAPVAADPRAFAQLLAREQVTVLNQVPTTFGYLVAELAEQPVALPSLRYVVFGGEPVSLPVVARWRALGVAPAAALVNMYGITETTVHVTHCPLTPDLAPVPGTTPVGRALPHLEVEVVDEQLREVPPGVPGELLVRGSSVAYGYLGRPELTAQRFLAVGGGIAYRTGDWGVRDGSGGLHHLGRRDRQVQVRGFRIELGEIEHAIAAHPQVAQCAVTADTTGQGEPLLAGHYVTVAGGELDPAELGRFVAERVPAPLVPARWRRHRTLPRTDHGKVDLARLSAD